MKKKQCQNAVILIKDLIDREKEKVAEKEKAVIDSRIFFKISSDEFKSLFSIMVKNSILDRKQLKEFIIDSQNKEIINNLYYYLIGNEKKFQGNLRKGILLIGNYGTGKTLILSAFCKIYSLLLNRTVLIAKAKELPGLISDKGIYSYQDKIIMIDDIGKEQKQVNSYGTISKPVTDLIDLRYSRGALTFATANNTLEDFKPHYGEMTTDRMKEMFNILVLSGKSRRA